MFLNNLIKLDSTYLEIVVFVLIGVLVISSLRFSLGRVKLLEALIYGLSSWVLAIVISINSAGYLAAVIVGVILVVHTVMLENYFVIHVVKDYRLGRDKIYSNPYLWGLIIGLASWGFISLGLGVAGILMYNGASALAVIMISLSIAIVVFWKRISVCYANLMLRLLSVEDKIKKI